MFRLIALFVFLIIAFILPGPLEYFVMTPPAVFGKKQVQFGNTTLVPRTAGSGSAEIPTKML